MAQSIHPWDEGEYIDLYSEELTIPYLPEGSEVPVNVALFYNPNLEARDRYIISISGGLRDFGEADMPALRKWWAFMLELFGPDGVLRVSNTSGKVECLHNQIV